MIDMSRIKLNYFLGELWVLPGAVLTAYSFIQLGLPGLSASAATFVIPLMAFIIGYTHSLHLNWSLMKTVPHCFTDAASLNTDTIADLNTLRGNIFKLPFLRAFWAFERFFVAASLSLISFLVLDKSVFSWTTFLWAFIAIILAAVLSAILVFFALERLCVRLHELLPDDYNQFQLSRRISLTISQRLLILLLLQFLLAVMLFGVFPLHTMTSLTSVSDLFRHNMINLVISFFLLSGLTLIFVRAVALGIHSSIETLRYSMNQAEHGDLGIRAAVHSTDEIGLLAIRFNQTMKALSDIFGRVKNVSDSVALVADRLSTSTVIMSEGVELQATSTDTTASSMSEMQASISEVADSINYLFNETEHTSGSILEMAASIEQVAENIESLSSSVDTTSSSIEEMNATIKQVAENAVVLNRTALDLYQSIDKIILIITEVEEWAIESSKLSNNVTVDAEKGSDAVQQTIEGMEKIHKFFQLSGEVIQNFAERSEQIGNIVNVIDDVSSQTNLLALNAAIISAQAGEHGKEFAVVADEIRDLAEKATLSTKEINHLIKSVQGEALMAVKTMEDGARLVAEGVKMSHRAGEVLTQITQSSIKSASMTSQIEEATIEQASRSRDIAQTLDNLKVMSDQLAKATKEQKIGISQIMREAENMRDMTQLVRSATEKQATESRSISQAISDVKLMVERIRIATTQQKSGSKSILEAVEIFKDITLKNVDSMVEMDKAVDTLSSQVKSLETQVSRFSV